MKKAKIMLLGIVVCAVVGGALAFKTVKSNHNLFWCTTTTTINPLVVCTTAPYNSTIVGVTVPTSTLYTTNALILNPACLAPNTTVGCGINPAKAVFND